MLAAIIIKVKNIYMRYGHAVTKINTIIWIPYIWIWKIWTFNKYFSYMSITIRIVGVFSRSSLISLYHHVIIINTHANNSWPPNSVEPITLEMNNSRSVDPLVMNGEYRCVISCGLQTMLPCLQWVNVCVFLLNERLVFIFVHYFTFGNRQIL
jgi:hypothetical protein